MLVRDAMSTVVLTIGPTHTLRQAARLMSARRIGAAVVHDPDTFGLGIITERDILDAVGSGLDPDRETASAHTTTDVVFAAPSLDPGGGGGGDDARRVPAPDRAGRRRRRGHRVGARHHPLLVARPPQGPAVATG